MGPPRDKAHFTDLLADPIVNRNKHKIIDTAIDLFSRKGFNAVSVREITREVGIKESSLYNHFRSKEQLLETIFFNFRNEAAKVMPPVEQVDAILSVMTVEDFLERGYRNFIEHIGEPTMEKIWRMMFMEQFRNPVAREIYLNDIVGKTLAFLETVFAKLIGAGKIRPSDPKVLAAEYQYPLFAMVMEYVILRLDGRDTAGIERRMGEHRNYFYGIIKIS